MLYVGDAGSSSHQSPQREPVIAQAHARVGIEAVDDRADRERADRRRAVAFAVVRREPARSRPGRATARARGGRTRVSVTCAVVDARAGAATRIRCGHACRASTSASVEHAPRVRFRAWPRCRRSAPRSRRSPPGSSARSWHPGLPGRAGGAARAARLVRRLRRPRASRRARRQPRRHRRRRDRLPAALRARASRSAASGRSSAYGGSDDRSMAADNTSAFNCRYAVAAGPKRWSVHAYGEAIDVNTVENPYLEGGRVLPPAGRAYVDRRRSAADGRRRRRARARVRRRSAGCGAAAGARRPTGSTSRRPAARQHLGGLDLLEPVDAGQGGKGAVPDERERDRDARRRSRPPAPRRAAPPRRPTRRRRARSRR